MMSQWFIFIPVPIINNLPQFEPMQSSQHLTNYSSVGVLPVMRRGKLRGHGFTVQWVDFPMTYAHRTNVLSHDFTCMTAQLRIH